MCYLVSEMFLSIVLCFKFVNYYFILFIYCLLLFRYFLYSTRQLELKELDRPGTHQVPV